MKDIVFYSQHKKDIYSDKLIEMLSMTRYAEQFAYYKVNNNQKGFNEDVIALFELDIIPTIIFKGKQYEGAEAFDLATQLFDKSREEPRNTRGSKGGVTRGSVNGRKVGRGGTRVNAAGRGGGRLNAGSRTSPGTVGGEQEEYEEGVMADTEVIIQEERGGNGADFLGPTTFTGDSFTVEDIQNPKKQKDNGDDDTDDDDDDNVKDIIDTYRKELRVRPRPTETGFSASRFSR